jgi:hypothetical protein
MLTCNRLGLENRRILTGYAQKSPVKRGKVAGASGIFSSADVDHVTCGTRLERLPANPGLLMSADTETL